ncbi:hypothetical protein N7499_008754 [Penicillium canescens]|uniref:Transcription factor domain-containing protein n=1 Tax=Penicillium canescens TaxID=5083 RepID=A0AAD6I0U5_PENCN|nr:uncharacterized protein N7446_013758 [Penicillium canescens]KAJ5984993.1 hypothetical protein N7522_012189 [Penicillium canescens]KAJ6023398.1 hypothetical protein N7460_013793 [Penicillium canescens]KAJ6025329.1 hypothetical protein N7444_013008 [Penicillium canescens]KAJ6042692.1 hypothetical protein N7446_013758 [Penicillium canescens]KAJ6076773.1 hypothetical protein N7499_008754 [Penicillium canescens]
MRQAGSVPADLSQIPEGCPSASSSPSASTSISGQPLPSYLVDDNFPGGELDSSILLTGIPFLLPESQKLIQARTGRTISSDKLSLVRPPWEKEQGQSSIYPFINTSRQNFCELPDWRLVRLYFDAYRNSVMQRIFPVIDTDLFEETMIAAYSQPQSYFGQGQARSRICILAFLAFAASLPLVDIHLEDDSSFLMKHESLASKSQILLAEVVHEPPDMDVVQTVTMLARLFFSLISYLTLCGQY